MCTSQFWKSSSCGHLWVELKNPCGEGKNISNCRSFQDGRARNPLGLKCKWANEDSCPKCDKKDDYDGNKIRMVSSITPGLKCGIGPSKPSAGIECHCIVMWRGRIPGGLWLGFHVQYDWWGYEIRIWQAGFLSLERKINEHVLYWSIRRNCWSLQHNLYRPILLCLARLLSLFLLSTCWSCIRLLYRPAIENRYPWKLRGNTWRKMCTCFRYKEYADSTIRGSVLALASLMQSRLDDAERTLSSPAYYCAIIDRTLLR